MSFYDFYRSTARPCAELTRSAVRGYAYKIVKRHIFRLTLSRTITLSLSGNEIKKDSHRSDRRPLAVTFKKFNYILEHIWELPYNTNDLMNYLLEVMA